MYHKTLNLNHKTLLEHSGFIKALARSQMSRGMEAEDLEQEILVRALKGNSPRKTESWKAWLSSVARNFLKNKAKREKLEKAKKVRAMSERLVPSPEEIAEQNERIAKPAQAVI